MIRTSSPTRPAAPEARSPSRFFGLFSFAALVAASLASQPAQAGLSINAKTVYNNNGLTVAATYNNGTLSFNTGTVGSGSFTTTFLDASIHGPVGSTFETYCVDIATNLNAGTTVNADVSISANSSIADGKGAIRDIGAAGWVFMNYAGLNALALKTALNLTSLTVSEQQARTAIQVAIWDAAYDSQPGTTTNFVGSGNLVFTSIDATAKTLANAILAARGTQTSLVGFIDYPPPIIVGYTGPINQDQLFRPSDAALAAAVPEPSTLAMAAFGGVIGLGMFGRKRLMARKAKAMAMA